MPKTFQFFWRFLQRLNQNKTKRPQSIPVDREPLKFWPLGNFNVRVRFAFRKSSRSPKGKVVFVCKISLLMSILTILEAILADKYRLPSADF